MRKHYNIEHLFSLDRVRGTAPVPRQTMTKQIETDYLVIGGGAMGFAFADVILSETDATVTIVDRYHQPGGHWNLAYPFVRLHQPSSGYGVESRALGTNQIDK